MFSLSWAYSAMRLVSLEHIPEDIMIQGVSTDTRSLGPGQLFVALSGPNFDGHDFVAQAFAQGAIACLVKRGYHNPAVGHLIKADDTLRALGDLAAAWRKRQSLKLWAVTGSSGKTSTKDMLALILGQRYQVFKTQGNFNNFVGMPLTLLGLNDSHNAAVLEMGMSWPGEIARLTEIADPDIGLITNVGPAHLENLGSLKNTARAKTELWNVMNKQGTAVVNLDDPLLAPWARKYKGRAVTFGLSSKAMVRAVKPASHGFAQSFSLILPAGEPAKINLAVPGEHNMYNALAASAAAFAAGTGAEEIARGLAGYHPASGRFHLLRADNGTLVLDDAYNANPASVAAGLKTMATLLHGTDGTRRAVAVLGDMLELGAKSASLHHETGVCAAENNCSLLLAYGQQAPQVVKGAHSAGLAEAYAFAGMNDLQNALRAKLTPQDIVLIKGSNSMGMSAVVEFVLREYKES